MVQWLEVLLVEGWRGECPICSELGDGHFGLVRFKNFVNFDFDGHLVQDRFGQQSVIVLFVTRS